MRWPWRKPEIPKVEDNVEEAKAARINEQLEYRKLKSQSVEVRRVTESLADMRNENHLAAALRRALGG